MSAFRSGFVSLIGRPNAGKSTLLNALIGEKLAIVSEKPQTTRTTIQGVVNLPGAQIVFLDTPGIHKSASLLNKRMMETVRAALADRDVLLYVADASIPFSERGCRGCVGSEEPDDAGPAAGQQNRPGARQAQAAAVHRAIQSGPRIRRIYPGVGHHRRGPGPGARRHRRPAPGRPGLFPGRPSHRSARAISGGRTDSRTDSPSNPPGSAALRGGADREWKETPKITKIAATIYVERDGQKAIVIGAGGAALKKIGTLARHEIEKMVGRKVFLELFVKVQRDWRENPEFLNAIDWRSMRGGELDSDESPVS